MDCQGSGGSARGTAADYQPMGTRGDSNARLGMGKPEKHRPVGGDTESGQRLMLWPLN
jgi:hypothetical protein